jgi:hypothetical protein
MTRPNWVWSDSGEGSTVHCRNVARPAVFARDNGQHAHVVARRVLLSAVEEFHDLLLSPVAPAARCHLVSPAVMGLLNMVLLEAGRSAFERAGITFSFVFADRKPCALEIQLAIT